MAERNPLQRNDRGQATTPPRMLALALLASAAILAVPVTAAAANGARQDCQDGTGICASGLEPGQAVSLPELIVDLFPNPAGAPGQEPGGQPPAGDGGQSAGGPPSGPVDPANLPLVEPPRAIAGDFVPDEVLVTVDGGPGVVEQVAAAFGLEVRSQRQSALLGATIARLGIPDGRPVGTVLAQLAADGRASRREPNSVFTLQQGAGAASYAFQRIALDAAAASGEGVRVAVIDTAVDETHPVLQGVIAAKFDAMPDVATVSRDHGTSIDGLIAGIGPLPGMAPGAAIYHARAFEDGRSTMDAILAALDWAVGEGVQIVNMSFVGPKNELLGAACAKARARGVVLVAAAGNNGPGAPYGYPAAFPGVMAVTATDSRDGLMQQANRGAYVYIAAPGVDLVAPIGGGQDLVTGTSFASAVVAGAVANLLRGDPNLSVDQLEKALAETAVDLGPEGRDEDFGYGLLNVTAAAEAR